MNTVIYRGKIKFYSREKGYGFIYSPGNSDIYFHITNIVGYESPGVGDLVSFSQKTNPKNGKTYAENVLITQKEIHTKTSNQTEKSLNGFPCIRGSTINGFVLSKSLGHIVTGLMFLSPNYPTLGAARNGLINLAKRKGANAIFNFHYENNKRREKAPIFGWYAINKFWAEGTAVILKPDC